MFTEGRVIKGQWSGLTEEMIRCKMEHYKKWDRGKWEEEQVYREQGGGRPAGGKRREKKIEI